MGGCVEPSDAQSAEDSPFICGVVEGFYGRPWTSEQRKELFEKLRVTIGLPKSCGQILNTHLE